MIDLTIIVPTLTNNHSAAALEECMKSLLETTENCPIIIASNKDQMAWLEWDAMERVKRIHLLEQGQCKAVNAAAAITNTKWIFVTNNDMIYPPTWLERLLDGVSLKNRKLCLSPNLVEPRRGAVPFIEYFCGGAGGDFNKERFLKFAREHEERQSESGFNLPFLMRREFWNKIGGYDINYDPWGSNGDSDLQAKIILAGGQTLRNRNSIVYHFSQTSGTFHPDNREYWNKNWIYFKDKWGFERKSGDDVWYSRNIIDYENLIYKPEWAKLKE